MRNPTTIPMTRHSHMTRQQVWNKLAHHFPPQMSAFDVLLSALASNMVVHVTGDLYDFVETK